MITDNLKENINSNLYQLKVTKNIDFAEKIIGNVLELFGAQTEGKFLINLPRIDAEISRFQLAQGFEKKAAAYEIQINSGLPIDIKLFWVKKITKTNLSWLTGLTPNYEDSISNDYKNIGIDFIVDENCNSIYILLTNKYKVRALELKENLTPTQSEILSKWSEIGIEKEFSSENIKQKLHSFLWESFNFEPINKRFYKELVECFSLLANHLEKDFGRKPAVMFTTRLIGRMLFVWFLKKKNFINNKIEYFNINDFKDQKEYYTNKLEVLFFNVLNQEFVNKRINGDNVTPYLNGGLFSPTETDFYNTQKLSFPHGYFNNLIGVLNKYNFTVDESSPEFQHVAVDPEMLGRIFESLLNEQIDEYTGSTKRKVTGAVYTPREIVSFMCEEQLIYFLKSKLPYSNDRNRRIEELVRMPESLFRDQDQNKRRDWKPYKDSILILLEGDKKTQPISILDPAVGSGAFPMGMLHLLVKVYTRLDSRYENNIAELKRKILSQSIYGVDIEQTAIEITKLRAWLSIIVDIKEDREVEPLPNLEFKFVCANTLLSLEKENQENLFSDVDLKNKLIYIRNEYFKTSSKTLKEKLQKEYLRLTGTDGLFDSKKTLQLKSYQPFNPNSSSSFYDPELMHGLSKFDLIIGNPPYVNVEKVDKSIKSNIHLFSFAYQKYDLYVLFFEKSLQLLKKEGILNFITSNKFLSQGYGYILRNELLKLEINYLINFNYDIFDSAVVRTCILQVTNKFNNSNKIKVINVESKKDKSKFENLDFEEVDQSIFLKTHENNFRINLNSDKILILNKIELRTKKLIDICSVNYGLRPSSEKLKLKKNAFIFKENINGTYKKYFEGKDMGYWTIKNFSYIDYKPDVMYNSMFKELFENEKLVGLRTLSDIHKLRFIYDDQKFYCNDSVVIITPWYRFENLNNKTIKKQITIDKINLSKNFSIFYILGILNSKLIKFYVNELMYDGTHFYPNHMKQLPIKECLNELQLKIEQIVKQIIILKSNNIYSDTTLLENQLNVYVYKIYDINEEQINLIEKSLKI